MDQLPSPSGGAQRARFGGLSAFRHPDYAKIWTGAFVSNIGTWMENIAVGVYVTETTGKAGWTGTIAALMFLPAVVLGPIGGALADRFDRRRYLMVGTALQTVLAGTLALLAGLHRLSLPSIALLMLLTGSASTLVNPAFSALLAEIVPPEDLLSALSLSSAQYNLGRVIGPILAAAVIATGGYTTAFVCNTLSFFATMIALAFVRASPEPEQRRELSIWSEIRAGIDVARSDSGIRLALLIIGATSVLISPFIGLVPAFAITVFHGGAEKTSVMVACQGTGAVIAAVAAGGIAERYGRGRLLGWAVAVMGPLAVVYWLSPRFSIALPLIFLMGATYLALVTGANTICLSRVAKRLQARVSSLVSLVLGGGYAIGLIVLGWGGDRIGLRTAGVLAGVIFVGLWLALRRRSPDAFPDLDETPHPLRVDAVVVVPTVAGPARLKAK